MIGLALYALALLYTSFSSDPIIKHTKKCKYCRQRINEKVSGITKIGPVYRPLEINLLTLRVI